LKFDHQCFTAAEADSYKREQLMLVPAPVEWRGLDASRVMWFASLFFVFCAFGTMLTSFDEIIANPQRTGMHLASWLFLIFAAGFFITGCAGKILDMRGNEGRQAEDKLDRELSTADIHDLKRLVDFADRHTPVREAIKQWTAAGKVIRSRDMRAIHVYVAEQERIIEGRNRVAELDAVMAELSGL